MTAPSFDCVVEPQYKQMNIHDINWSHGPRHLLLDRLLVEKRK